MSDFDFHMCGKDLYMFDFIQWMCVSVRLSVCCLQTIYRQCEQDHKEQASVPALVSPLSNRTIVNTTAAPTKRFECCACVCDFRVKVETSAVSFLEICWWLTGSVWHNSGTESWTQTTHPLSMSSVIWTWRHFKSLMIFSHRESEQKTEQDLKRLLLIELE